MKKSIAAVLIAVLLMYAVCFAAGGYPNDAVFDKAKQSVILMCEGSYDAAVKLTGLPASGNQLKAYIEDKCGNVQRMNAQHDVSVAWYDGSIWKIAVPFELPGDDMVPAVVYTLNENGTAATCEVLAWRYVEMAYKQANQVKWNVEYNPGFIVVVD